MAKKILIISSVLTHPSTAGNRVRIATFSSELCSFGHEIYFLLLNDGSKDIAETRDYWGSHFFEIPYKKPKRKLAQLFKNFKKNLKLNSAHSYNIDDWYDLTIDNYVKGLSRSIQFDAVVVEYVFFSKVLCNFGTNVLKIIDTHSVYTDRHMLQMGSGVKPNGFSTSAKQEKKGLSRADVIIAIQDNDKEYFKSLIPSRKIITVGHIVPLISQKPECIHANSILIIASYNLSNLHSFKFFMEEVYPNIIKKIPSVKVILAGDLCENVSDYEGLIKEGRVDELSDLYSMAAIVVNPAMFGTGLKIKTIEALGNSKPLVTTSVGADGLEEGIGNSFLTADTAEDFATHIINVLNDISLSNNLSSNAYKYACIWNEKCSKELNMILR